ncbi:MAG: UDP-N-acetylmuramate dehydrogenase [Deltaproteobacteria bacterium]|nr:UDP-N-acetylmuramate dehydrogenase [Deltaproteobacteria bacterium]
MTSVIPALIDSLRKAAQGDVSTDFPLAVRTSVRVGGAARIFVKPKDPQALVAALGVLSDAGVPWHALGGGANTIVGDAGIDGAVFKLGTDFSPDQVEEQGDAVLMTLGAGAPSSRFVSLAKDMKGVGVAAWASGIPGTIGGLVAMNAGTPAGSMSDHLEAVEVATPSGLSWIPKEKLELRYRHCKLPKGAVLSRARCRVRRGTDEERAAEQRAVKADLEKRKRTQPLTQPNSGSVFVNPPGDFAGRLIEAAGLKGTQRGGAQISSRHANFIVNVGEAKAADVIDLLVLARRAVKNATGIDLVPEVRLVGTFDPPLPAELEPHHQLPIHLAREQVHA